MTFAGKHFNFNARLLSQLSRVRSDKSQSNDDERSEHKITFSLLITIGNKRISEHNRRKKYDEYQCVR